MEDLSIQPCSLRLLTAVHRLHRTTFPYPYPFWRLVFYRLRYPRFFLIAHHGSQLVGYVIASRSYLWGQGWAGEIVSLATIPQARQQGVATRLLTQVLGNLQRAQLPVVYLQVAVSNHPAQQLYHKMGFQYEKRLPRYYSNGEDAFLLRKILPPGAGIN